MSDLRALPPGLIAVIGGERSGKTSFLRRLSGNLIALTDESLHPDAQWLDLDLPTHDDEMPHQVWAALRLECPRWSDELQQELVDALNLQPHLEKKLYMLSNGSRRKVALVALLSSGATVTCLDQPYAALDFASIKVLREFLGDMAEHATRSWVVADYVADPQLHWKQVISMDS